MMSAFAGLSDANLTALCLANGTSIDPNCACLLSGGGPELNTDISGPGVRISFYLQALFLALLAARSGSLEEISGALYTLIATNVSMAITSLILGFKTQREMSLHDAIVVLYLLAGSWLAIFFSLPSYNRFVKSDTTLQILTVVHSFVIFAFILAVLVTARTFGSTPRCNTHAVAVIFFHFPALNAGRISAFVFVCLVICGYSFLSLSDYYRVAVDEYDKFRKRQRKREKAERAAQLGTMPPSTPGTLVTVGRHLPDMERGFPIPGPSRPTFASPYETDAKAKLDERLRAQANLTSDDKKKRRVKERYYMKPKATSKAGVQREHSVFITGLLGSLLIEVIVIVILWTLFVMNTELLILWNRFDGGGDGLSSNLWGFGQILPMFLVLLPFVQLTKAFKKWKLRRREHHTQRHRRGPTAEEKAAKRAQRYAERHGYAQGHGHIYGHGHGHRHAPPGAGMGWMPPFFFQGAAGAPAHPFGNQPSAHISVNSVHSEKVAPGPSREREREGDDEVGSRRSSESNSTSSSFSTSTSSASSSVPSLADGCTTVAGGANLGDSCVDTKSGDHE